MAALGVMTARASNEGAHDRYVMRKLQCANFRHSRQKARRAPNNRAIAHKRKHVPREKYSEVGPPAKPRGPSRKRCLRLQ